MNYSSLILFFLVSVQSFGQLDTIKKSDSSKPVLIRIGRPANENNEPLFILDGKPIDSKEFKNINPESIESITVLKDSGATAFYGKGGINGVIIIKTKKLSKREIRKMKKKKLPTATAN